ncbi:helix-turn-helix domain-containing protein [Brucella sp. 21LCYQ03]|nr:helix-turn-helix domain-containing protein [Brucella sp. 21LCYQ03]
MKKSLQILALRDVASQIDRGDDIHSILQNLIESACQHANWTLGSIMSIDAAHGYAHVIVRHDPTLIERNLPDRWELATSPSLMALQKNEPIYIRDVRQSDEFPGYRAEAFERDYRTVLVIPMNCLDIEDRPMVLSVISRKLTDVTQDDLAFLGTIIHLGAIAIAREHRLEVEKRTARRLDNALKAHTSLLEHVLSDGSVASLSEMVDSLLPNPTIVVDFTTNQINAGASPDEKLFDTTVWREAVSNIFARSLMKTARDAIERSSVESVSFFLDDGNQRIAIRARVEALTVDKQLVGALILFPTAREFSDLDHLMLDSVKFALSVEMMRSFIRFRFETRTQTELFFEVVEARWRDANDISQRAHRLGLNFSIKRQILLIDFPRKTKALGGTSIDVDHMLSRIMNKAGIEANLIAIEGGAVCLVPFENSKWHERIAKLTKKIAEELGHYFGEEPIVVNGDLCEGLADYPAAWERCNRMVRIGRAFGLTGALSAQDLGPLPMLVAASKAVEIRGFVQDSVGAIAAHDQEHGTPYLETLSIYLQQGCRNQACADIMGLHVTTLRYRLTRIQELFGIDVEIPDKRFAVELAIRLYGVIDNQRSSAETKIYCS